MNKAKNVKVVYLILAHNNPNQIEKLIDKLDYKNNSFVIHFDLNGNDQEYKSLLNSFEQKGNVYFSNRNRCYWGDISLVDATIDCIKTVYKNKIDFDYAVLISGQHYPIKSNEFIEDKLRNANNNNFINHFKIPTELWKNGGVDRLIYYHFNKHPRKRYSLKKIFNRGLSLLFKKISIKRTPPIDINNFYGGSQWWCLTNECCAYILDFIRERPEIYRYFKNVLIPDEIFFQTLLLNSKYKEKIINNNLNYINWGDVPSASPLILDESHYKNLKKSSDLWARKFDVNKSMNLVKLLESDL